MTPAAMVAWEAAPKAFLYAFALLAIGVVVARWLVSRAAGDAHALEAGVRLEQRLAGMARLLAIAVLLALAARAWGHTAAAFGPAEALRWESLRVIALESRWGGAWRLQVLAAAGLLASAVLVRSGRRAGWLVYAVGAVAFCSVVPLLGHAAGSGWRVAAHAAHLVAGGAWLGTLASIALLRPVRADAAHLPEARDLTAATIRRFSGVALSGAAIAVATGLTIAAIYLITPANLLWTGYGQALVVKVAAVAAVAACGRANWQRSKRGDAPSAGLIATELGFAAFVVMVTSVLTELEHP